MIHHVILWGIVGYIACALLLRWHERRRAPVVEDEPPVPSPCTVTELLEARDYGLLLQLLEEGGRGVMERERKASEAGHPLNLGN